MFQSTPKRKVVQSALWPILFGCGIVALLALWHIFACCAAVALYS
jgi:hypothetical protein